MYCIWTLAAYDLLLPATFTSGGPDPSCSPEQCPGPPLFFIDMTDFFMSISSWLNFALLAVFACICLLYAISHLREFIRSKRKK